ncbi:MAG: ABC transporter permease, partial [Burkholderiales bacterium]
MAPGRALAGGLRAKVSDFRREFFRRYPTMVIGGALLVVMAIFAVFAPVLFTGDPIAFNPIDRLKPPGSQSWFGTDMFGRDIYSRTLYGARISLAVGLLAAVLSVAIGLVVGLVSGYVRVLDAILMRVIDGMMAIPGILLAIALVSLSGASVVTVTVAITIPEIPRVVRLVRSIVLSVREEPYVEAAVAAGTRLHSILVRHIMPNTFAPLIVQATYI